MKSLIATMILSACFLFSQAQIQEVVQNMSQGSKNGLSVNLTSTDVKTVEAAWTKFLKDYKGKTKKNKKSNEVFTDNAEIKKMSSNTVDVYAQAVDNGEDVNFTVWFDLGGAYVSANSHPDAFTYSKQMLSDFSKTVSSAAIEVEVKMEEDVYKKLESEMKSLEKEMKNYEDEITKCEQKIEAAKANIAENKTAQAVKVKELEVQKDKLEAAQEKLKNFN